MGRLTARDSNRIPRLLDVEVYSLFAMLSNRERVLVRDAIDRLTVYEEAMPPERVAELAQAERAGRLVVLPCKVGDAVDKLFSHNEIIALHIEYPEYYQRLWRGEAWRLPEQYKDHELVRFAGFVSENVSESDTINLVIRPNQEAEAALEQRKESKNGK